MKKVPLSAKSLKAFKYEGSGICCDCGEISYDTFGEYEVVRQCEYCNEWRVLPLIKAETRKLMYIY